MRKDLEGRADVPAVTNGLASQVCSWMLIHGTTQDKVDDGCIPIGFDERLARFLVGFTAKEFIRSKLQEISIFRGSV